jgi:DNA polymerase III subunit delta'
MKTLIHPLTSTQVDGVRATRSGSYIFHGATGMGKARLAYELAREINCLGDDSALCARCRQFEAGAYPDLITVRPEDKPSILIEQIRSLAQALTLSLYYSSGTRVVVVDSAHTLTVEAQNALLKLIEEPPPDTLFILVTDHVQALLPTVRSRCAAIFFPKLPEADIASLLTRDHNIKPSEATALAAAAEGAPGAAVMLATNPKEAAARLELSSLVYAATSSTLFHRLLLAKRLADDKTDLVHFGRLVHARLAQRLRSGEGDVRNARGFEALERFRRAVRAKVAPRVALERLMLEL